MSLLTAAIDQIQRPSFWATMAAATPRQDRKMAFNSERAAARMEEISRELAKHPEGTTAKHIGSVVGLCSTACYDYLQHLVTLGRATVNNKTNRSHVFYPAPVKKPRRARERA